MTKDIAVVVPTNRPEQMQKFLDAWKEKFEFQEVALIICEDNPTKSKFKFGKYYVEHYCWKDIDWFLGKNAWIIPRKCDGIRSFGFLMAYAHKYNMVVTLDDDCMPRESDIMFQAYRYYFDWQYEPASSYFDVGKHFLSTTQMRGFPFKERKNVPVLIQYGGWDNVPDFDAVSQSQKHIIDGFKFKKEFKIIPKYLGFTGCIMNTAIKREAIPMMYQLLMGVGHPYDRWGDIWSGLFAKKVCDRLGYGIAINGLSSIVHTRASNTLINLKKESSGYGRNEDLWDNLIMYPLQGDNIIDCYYDLREFMEVEMGDYGKNLSKAVKVWVHYMRAWK